MLRLDGRDATVLGQSTGAGDPDYEEVVAALSLLAPHDGGQRILLGVRSERCSAHGDVMSLPTLRLPRVVADQLLDHREDNSRWVHMRTHEHTEHALVFLCRAIMALKLGLADWVVEERFDYRCRLGTVLVGNTAVDETTDPPRVQRIAMVNLVCELPVVPPVPPHTAGYSSLRWADPAAFLDAVRLRDATLAAAEWDCVSVCVRGLCVEVGARDLAAR